MVGVTPALSDLLPDPDSVAAIRAIHDTHGREAAVLILQEFQAGFIVGAKLDPKSELHTEVPAYGKAQGHVQGRLV